MIGYKGYISILLILTISTSNGMAMTDGTDGNVKSISTKSDGLHMSNVDIQKIKDKVKKVDYDKFANIKPEDSSVITEDNISGIARVDYVYHAKFQEGKEKSKEGKEKSKEGKFNVVQKTNSASSISSGCYKKFGKWSGIPIYYVINPSNSQSISQELITSNIFVSSKAWDDAISRNLFGKYTIDPNAKVGVYDRKNVIGFGQYSDSGVLAVTSVWYNTDTKQIYEFDIRFNTRFRWGNVTINSYPYLMDIRDIATHEIGHGIGLDDLYQSYCSQATMYGYSPYREIQKRTLESGDINGIRNLYGN